MKRQKKEKVNRQHGWSLRAGLWLSCIMIALILIGFFWTPFDPEKMNGAAKFLSPGFPHLFGCDHFGRDIFSRALKGGGTTFLIAVVTVLGGALIGTVVGALSAYAGGIIDGFLMRVVDGIAAFPSVLLALVLIGLFGPGKYKIMVALVIAFIHSFTRVMRSEFLKYKEMD